MEKTITFNIPEGYVIDKENSTTDNIVLKLDVSKLDVPKLAESTKVRTWEEYCKKMKGKISYYIDPSSGITLSIFGNCPFLSEFETKEGVKAFEAYSKLLKLRKDWVGEWKSNWANNYQKKYIICNYSDIVAKDTVITASHGLSFPTAEMRDDFFDCFKDYLEQAKDLI